MKGAARTIFIIAGALFLAVAIGLLAVFFGVKSTMETFRLKAEADIESGLALKDNVLKVETVAETDTTFDLSQGFYVIHHWASNRLSSFRDIDSLEILFSLKSDQIEFILLTTQEEDAFRNFIDHENAWSLPLYRMDTIFNPFNMHLLIPTTVLVQDGAIKYVKASGINWSEFKIDDYLDTH